MIPISEHAAGLLQRFRDYAGACNVNLGCGVSGTIPAPGWYNVDRDPRRGIQVAMDLENGGPGPYLQEYWDVAPGTVDLVLASHVLEHIRNFIPLMEGIYRMLRPGGHLVALTPHAGHDAAWEDPTHVRAFTQNSWDYFTPGFHESQTGHGSYVSRLPTFEIVSIELVPDRSTWERLNALGLHGPERSATMMDWARRERNVVAEIAAILRKA